MKYMLLIYGAESCWTETEREECMVESMQISEELASQGKLLASAPLHSVTTATSLRVRNGQRLITDGPFAETTEQLGGYYIIDVDNLDEAIAVASRLPPATKGTVEIRPLFDVDPVREAARCDILNQRDFPFSQEEIFQVFSDPSRLARWWGPNGFSNTFSQFEFHTDGNWRFVMHGPDGKNYENHNLFRTIAPHQRIVIEHVSEPHFVLTVTLTKITERQTRLRWQQRFDTPEIRDNLARVCVDFNEQNLDRMLAELKSTV